MSGYFSMESWISDVLFYEKRANEFKKFAEENPANLKVVKHAEALRELADLKWDEFWGGDSKFIDYSKKIVKESENALSEILRLADIRDTAWTTNFAEVVEKFERDKKALA